MRKRYYIQAKSSELWIKVQLKEVRKLQDHHGKEKVIFDIADSPVVFVEIKPN